ncbi:MAG TPA: AAA family ATPase [Candidatus Krumholzibacteria bacterium]|nr:AAA family ATPase [Candidatus Krumholzibacteria bacterium]
MRVTRLAVHNVKRIKDVEIVPDGSLVIIGGKNGQGKSTGLDSIVYAIGGERNIPTVPIRNGKSKAFIVLETEELVIKRTFTRAGSYLKVVDRNGVEVPSPQTALDKLYSAYTFDPLAFTRMKSKEQVKVLAELVGVDLEESEARRTDAFNDRRDLNRDIKKLEATLVDFPHYLEVPDEPIDLDALHAEQRRREINNAENRKREDELKRTQESFEQANTEIAQLEQLLEQKKAHRDKLKERGSLLWAQVQEQKDEDVDELTERIVEAADVNRRIESNEKRAKLETECGALMLQADELTAQLKTIDEERALAISKANMPVAGLAFDEESVLFGGVPFDQCSSAEQLRVSVAMGIALNPELRVMLIHDGSLLDEDSQRMIEEMAKAADFQIWIEKVGNVGHFILVDGQLADLEGIENVEEAESEVME